MKILLVCSTGMSTSLLVNKMNEISSEKSRNDEIWAVPQSELENNIKKCDVLLIGPQMRMMLPQIKKLASDNNNVPYALIPANIYSRVDGSSVLELADTLLNS